MAEAIGDAFWNLLVITGDFLAQFPLLRHVIDYIRRSYQNDPYRVLLEILLASIVLYYLLKGDKRRELEIPEVDVEFLIRDWEPEPLVPKASLEAARVDEVAPPVITGACNLRVALNTGEKLQNWASSNFLGLQNGPEITEAAIQTVRGFGVGTCGPAGFYGSMDVHLELEEKLAKLLQVEEAIIYSQGFMAVASVIPAFCKRGDIIVADDGVAFAAQSGLEISRSHVYFFAHNDMQDLERVLRKVDEDCLRKKMPLSRRFIVAEGLYAKHGDKCPLPRLLELKKKFKYRLILDETLSFGTLGPHGLGITDYYGIPAREIELIAGSFSASLGSSGGFCAGSHVVVDHQRLSSQAYCYSAALPALLAVAANLALERIQTHPEMLRHLARNVEAFAGVLDRKIPKRFVLVGDRDSPLRLLQLAQRHEDPAHEVSVINGIVAKMRAKGYLVARDKHVPKREKFVPPPSVKLCISAGFSKAETESFAKALLSSLEDLS